MWFEVQSCDAGWIPKLVQNGYSIHHGYQDQVTLLKWLPKHETNPVNIS